MLREDRVVERYLLGKEKLCPLQHPRQEPRPDIPVRGVPMQCEHAAINHRVAAQAIGGTPTKGFAIILPRQCPAKRLRPFVVALVSAIDLRSDRELVTPRSRNIKIDHPPILNPSIGIDPQIHLVSWKMTPQKRPRHLCLERLGHPRAIGKFEVPIWTHDMAHPRRQPVAMFSIEPEIENPDRRVLPICANRQNRVAQQRKVGTISTAGDQQASTAFPADHTSARTGEATGIGLRVKTPFTTSSCRFSLRSEKVSPAASRAPRSLLLRAVSAASSSSSTERSSGSLSVSEAPARIRSSVLSTSIFK